jgi:hypothetical protein
MDLKLRLEESPTADSIYYADLFAINGRSWLIMGAGKSEAARIATDNAKDADIGRDCFALSRRGEELFARFDPGALVRNPETSSTLHKWHKVDIVAYCFSESETEKAFANRSIALLEADNELVGYFASVFPYPAYLAHHFVSGDKLEWLKNPARRLAQFKVLTSGVRNTIFVVVPFMPTVEQKAQLYCSFEPSTLVEP